MKKIILGLFSLTLFIAGLNNEIECAKQGSLTVQNIGLLQASAGEMWCDAKNQKECTIGSSKATGYLYSKD